MLDGMGIVVPRGDWSAMGQAVVDIMQAPDRYAKSREHIERTFNLEETVDRYEKHFRRAAGRGAE